MYNIFQTPDPVYVCPLCESQFADITSCYRCIRTHASPSSLASYEGYDDEYNCPAKIFVKLSDDRIARYYLSGIEGEEAEE